MLGIEIQNIQAALGVDSCYFNPITAVAMEIKIIFQHTGDFLLSLDIK